jgi:hypothetical protein
MGSGGPEMTNKNAAIAPKQARTITATRAMCFRTGTVAEVLE